MRIAQGITRSTSTRPHESELRAASQHVSRSESNSSVLRDVRPPARSRDLQRILNVSIQIPGDPENSDTATV